MGAGNESQEMLAKSNFKTTVIPPLDYTLMQKRIDELSQENKRLKNANIKLRKILENGEICRTEELVNDFKRETKKSLGLIAEEVNKTDFSSRTIDAVNELIDFLSYMKNELYSLVSISNEGYFAYSEELRQCEKLKEDLLGVLGKSSFTSSVIPDEAERMAKALKDALSNIADCMKEDE